MTSIIYDVMKITVPNLLLVTALAPEVTSNKQINNRYAILAGPSRKFTVV